MKEETALRLLEGVLEARGAEWIAEGGYLRFPVRHGGMVWETDCRPCENGMLIYARFPFRPEDRAAAERVCGEVNRGLVRGALFLTEEGELLYRCRAELDDVFGAEDRLEAALVYSARVVTRYWGRLAAPEKSQPMKFT